MLARSRVATTRVVAKQQQCRSAQTVPRLGTEEEMRKEAIEQIRARVAYQKELMKGKGHSHAEELEEMYKWIKISFLVGFPVCFLSSLYSFVNDKYHHRVEEAAPEYLKIRSKEFPWDCSDCDLFDLKCWKKCRAEK